MAADRLQLSGTRDQLADPLAQIAQAGGGDDRRGSAIAGGGWTFDAHGLVVERGVDGDRFTRLCVRHQWASLTVSEAALLDGAECPLCAFECVENRSRARYAALHGRLAERQGDLT